MLETQIKVRTESFDGPLSLLLHLIQKQEMSIRDFNLNLITKQYLDYIAHMQELNFDLAGDYLYMASALLYLKSQSAVTEEEQTLNLSAEDAGLLSRETLIARLEELSRFQALGKKLWALPKRDEDIFIRPKLDRKALINSILSPMELSKLTLSMMDLLKKQARKFQMVKRDRLSIREKLVELKTILKLGETARFHELLKESANSDDIVITFISLLEMARLKKLQVFQNEPFGEIYIELKEDLSHFDVDLANGFEPEEPEVSGPTGEQVEMKADEIRNNVSDDQLLDNVVPFPEIHNEMEDYQEKQ